MNNETTMEHKINMSIEEYMLVKNILNTRRKISDEEKLMFTDMVIGVLSAEFQKGI